MQINVLIFMLNPALDICTAKFIQKSLRRRDLGFYSSTIEQTDNDELSGNVSHLEM